MRKDTVLLKDIQVDVPFEEPNEIDVCREEWRKTPVDPLMVLALAFAISFIALMLVALR